MVPILKVRLPDGTVKPIAVVAAPNLLAPHADSHAVDGTDPLKPEDVGAVKKTGDTMSGTLSINKSSYPTYRLFELDTSFSSNLEQHDGVFSAHTGISGQKNYRSLQLYHDSKRRDVEKSLCLKDVDSDGEQKFYNILHEGNKNLIKPDDIGAVKKTGDTMTGTLGLIGDYVRLVFRDSTKGYAYLEKAKDDNGNVALYNERDTNNRSALQLYSENAAEAGLLRLIVKKNGVSTERRVLHEGNLDALGICRIETGSFVGAINSSTEEKPITITFKGNPKMLFFVGGQTSTTYDYVNLMVNPINKPIALSSQAGLTTATWGEKSITVTGDYLRLNYAGKTYSWFAIY